MLDIKVNLVRDYSLNVSYKELISSDCFLYPSLIWNFKEDSSGEYLFKSVGLKLCFWNNQLKFNLISHNYSRTYKSLFIINDKEYF